MPELVRFDFEDTWIKEISFIKPLDELLYQLQHDKDITGRYWALNEIASIAAEEKTTGADKEKIKAAYLSVLQSNVYWRFKSALLFQLRNMMPLNDEKNLLLDTKTKNVVLQLIDKEKSWLKASAISFLGNTKDAQFVHIYLDALNDKSDRVINAAAIALGKTKSARAFAALEKLVDKPSMKSQSLLSALAGLRELGDVRGFDIAYKALADSTLPRWRLPTGAVWDYRVVAANNIAALKMGGKAYSLLLARLNRSMEDNDLDGIFNNALLISLLAEPKAQEVFDILKERYKADANTLQAANRLEEQFKASIKAE